MKTSLALAFFIMGFCPMFSSSIKYDEGKPYVMKEFTLEDDGQLSVKTSGGNITVSGQGGNQVKVEMYVMKSGKWLISDNDIKEELENYKITIKKEGNTIYALAQNEGRNSGWFSSNDVSISFKVYVPNKIGCDLKTSGGNIILSKVIGEQKVHTSGGNLSLNSIRGDLNARTSGGNIKINNYKGSLDAHTSGGSIKIFEAKGVMKAHTSGGEIELDEVYGSINADTSGGNIKANIKEIGKYIDMHTSGGNIHATIPDKIGLDLNLKGSPVKTKLSHFNGESKDDKVVGKVHGGGIPFKLSTSGGKVRLDYHM